jgi:hypothetical protein
MLCPQRETITLRAGAPEPIRASYEAHRNDFDYLQGDWK